jgi:hypothetical protein
MKSFENGVPGAEMRKNLIAGGVAGAGLGLFFGLAFENILLGLIVGILFGAAVGFRISRTPPPMRYPMFMLRRMLVAGGFVAATTFVYLLVRDGNLTLFSSRWAVMLPVVGWAIFVISIGMAIASLDEMQRRIQTEAIAIGFAGTIIVLGGYALLQIEGFARVNVGVFLLVMMLMWLVGKVWTLWKYR